jgi:hypothetical protein
LIVSYSFQHRLTPTLGVNVKRLPGGGGVRARTRAAPARAISQLVFFLVVFFVAAETTRNWYNQGQSHDAV